jgi:hypothetical protein
MRWFYALPNSPANTSSMWSTRLSLKYFKLFWLKKKKQKSLEDVILCGLINYLSYFSEIIK